MAYIYPFRMVSATTTNMLIDPVAKAIMIAVRNDDAWVFPGADSLCGGFLEAKYTDIAADMMLARKFVDKVLDIKQDGNEFHDGETLEQCAVREISEETNVVLDEKQLHLFTNKSNPRTDTRAHVINACYWATLRPEQVANVRAGDDIKEIWWLPFSHMTRTGDMAFNHKDIMLEGFSHYKREILCRTYGI